MPRKILCLSGGGVRIYGLIGALAAAQELGIDFSQFDIIQATSSGSIVGLMLQSGMDPRQVLLESKHLPIKSFVDTGFLGLSLFFGGFSNKKLGIWANSLNVEPSDRLVVNTFDKTTNSQKIFTKKDYEQKGYGYALRCSTCYPVAFTPIDGKYIDGGVCENPLMLNLNEDDQILCIHLGYAGEVKDPKFTKGFLGRVESGIKALEFLNYQSFAFMVDKFPNIDIIRPKIYDVPSVNFWISDKERDEMIKRGKQNTKEQWKAILKKWT